MRVDLRTLSSHDLIEALERIETGKVRPPWSTGLSALPAVARALQPLDTVSAAGIVALLAAVVAERAAMPPPIEVVWTGPEPVAAMSRDTSAVVAGLFRDATREVLVSCYALDSHHGTPHSLFRPLHQSMLTRGVKTTLFFDLERCAKAAGVLLAAATHADVFLKLYWPFGPPFPDLYFDPRALESTLPCSMHAKMVVVDRRFVLVGSANLTDRGQTRNIELGVKIDDALLAERITNHWAGAAANGGFRSCVRNV
jgi:PLD-like domain